MGGSRPKMVDLTVDSIDVYMAKDSSILLFNFFRRTDGTFADPDA